ATSAELAAHAAKAAGRDLGPFFKYWLNETGLPRLELLSTSVSSNAVQGVLRVQGGPPLSNVEVTVEFGEADELTQVVGLDAESRFEIRTAKPAHRLVIDKYARMARVNGSQADLKSFADDVSHTLIV